MNLASIFPSSLEDLVAQGLSDVDFVLVTGDAFIDHSSYGAAIIARVLKNRGYSVGIISQPDWKNPESIKVLGHPRLGFLKNAETPMPIHREAWQENGPIVQSSPIVV